MGFKKKKTSRIKFNLKKCDPSRGKILFKFLFIFSI